MLSLPHTHSLPHSLTHLLLSQHITRLLVALKGMTTGVMEGVMWNTYKNDERNKVKVRERRNLSPSDANCCCFSKLQFVCPRPVYRKATILLPLQGTMIIIIIVIIILTIIIRRKCPLWDRTVVISLSSCAHSHCPPHQTQISRPSTPLPLSNSDDLIWQRANAWAHTLYK